MNLDAGQPDPTRYIERLSNDDAFYREAAAMSLGSIGSPRAARPLAGLLLRELESVERSGYITHDSVVRAVVEAIRRIGATEALYALVKALCVLSRSKGVNRETVVEIVECLGEVGGLNAVREAADRVVRSASDCCCETCPGVATVGGVLLDRLMLCGDAALATLQRLSRVGPRSLRPLAQRALAQL